ncbi:MAG: redoxin domain-containing protein [Planctomycetales bacterium]|nr:redoxin domain-containing protein [Planctomycetales bacterium]
MPLVRLLSVVLAGLLCLPLVAAADDSKPAEPEKPAETKPEKPAETTPADANPAEAKPAEAKPAETPAEAKPGEKPAEETPAEEKPTEEKPAEPNEPAAGHSMHGEAFNEGPRQAAYLMPGMANVTFPVTTKNEQVQKFINQGVAQLHGFWYFEAERSFRQAAALEADCAIAYWGMAMANANNEKRSKGFIDEAVKRKGSVSERERMYIEALDTYLKGDAKKKKERGEAYARALEKILYKFPDDVEAKAFLALQLWGNRSNGSTIASYLAVDALLQQVFAANPMHPAHHYRIHLWDLERPETAVSSAAVCGQTTPGIAHMWHMSGHIFSRLKRYDDAVWQQEASARVDHAHMMRDQVLPDQIHNFAHNNEWLIRNLNHIGRVTDAIALAKNMIELPQHPKYNTLSRRGSARYGRERLFETLVRYELWDDLIALCDTSYLEPTDDETFQIERLRHLGAAHLHKHDVAASEPARAELQRLLDAAKRKRDDAGRDAAAKALEKEIDRAAIDKAVAEAEEKAKADGKDEAQIAEAKSAAEKTAHEEQVKKAKSKVDKAKADAERPFAASIRSLEKALSELDGLKLVAEGKFAEAIEPLKKASADALLLAHVRLKAGEKDQAIKDAESYVRGHAKEAQPAAALVELLWEADERDKAKQAFEQLRAMSNNLEIATPVFARLEPIAVELGYPTDWRVMHPSADDVGERPPIESLGPFRWQPPAAADWTLPNIEDQPVSLKQYQGRPVLLIFYLGYGCLHCAEQLQAFAPMMQDFEEAGIAVVAISSDDREGLKRSRENYDKGDLPIPLVADPTLETFKAYRAYDDFEQTALHGTFLIDGQGKIRWQDISYEPFMEPKFVLKEAQRLLSQTTPAQDAARSDGSVATATK